MSYLEDFTSYSTKYLEIREIFEYVFPIKQTRDRSVHELNKIMKRYLEELDDGKHWDFEIARNDSVYGKKKHARTCMEHHSYKTNNELWYNLIFTMYPNDDDTNKDFSCNERWMAMKRNSEKLLDIFSVINGCGFDFNKNDIYNFFRVMDKITPFSTLGFWLFLRTRGQISLRPVPLIFHGNNPRNGGLQEVLYLISYFIQKTKNSINGVKVYINKTGPFILKKILYEDVSLYQDQNNPYILASCMYHGKDTDIKIYVHGNMDLKLKLKAGFSVENPMCLDEAEKKKTVEVINFKEEYVYNFYVITNENMITGGYLVKKIEKEGSRYEGTGPKKKALDRKKIKYKSFKYYGYVETDWMLLKYQFTIPEKNRESFERWADSFGDFVFWEMTAVRKDFGENNYYAFFSKDMNTRSHAKELPTLLMKENNWDSLMKKEKTRVSLLELNWMLYTLRNYPNFSKMLLNTYYPEPKGKTSGKKQERSFDEIYAEKNFHGCISNIETVIRNSVEFYKSGTENDNDINAEKIAEINPFHDCGMPVNDLSENHVRKMRMILDDMKNIDKRSYYRCRKQESGYMPDGQMHNEILPYAVDFDVIKYNGSDKGIFIMSYDLVQKRAVAVPFKDFTFGESENGSDGKIDFKYGAYDKIYYFCSYFVKLFLADPKTAGDLMQELFDINISGDFKKFFHSKLKIYDIEESLESLDENAQKLFENSIMPWISYISDTAGQSQRQRDIENNGISLFTKKETDYKKMTGQFMLYFIKSMTKWKDNLVQWMDDKICEEFIIGDTYEDGAYNVVSAKYQENLPEHMYEILSRIENAHIPNEIQYINSVLKIHELVFRLVNSCNNAKNIELIYDYFRNFNCIGDIVYRKSNEDTLKEMKDVLSASSNKDGHSIQYGNSMLKKQELIFQLKKEFYNAESVHEIKDYFIFPSGGSAKKVYSKNFRYKDCELSSIECIGQTKKYIFKLNFKESGYSTIDKFLEEFADKIEALQEIYYFNVQFEGFAYRKIHEIILALGEKIIEVPEEIPTDVSFETSVSDSLAKTEQREQSRLLAYRSKEGKKCLKETIQADLKQNAMKKEETFEQ